ncbi:MAG: hypothetical protein U0325_07100 [Polyangiales bacterium]
MSRHAPAQSVSPVTHDVTQVPAAQTCPLAQARPQAPQFAPLSLREVSQPLPLTPSQSPYPSAQTCTQVPLPSQRAVAFATLGHGVLL